MFEEGRKLIPQDELMNNPYRLHVFSISQFLYNMGIATKFAVNLNLYFKTIDNLGTTQHDELKMQTREGLDIGCFALTELGHGSNVRGILTTAHYDAAREEFIINSPSDLAMKFWIGGAAKTSNMAVVCAQLILKDGKS